MPILPLLWANKELIAKIIGVAVVAFVCYWFFIHNPKVIKKLETEKAELTRQVEARDAAINMLGNIERDHEIINRVSFKTISSIRYLPKPARDGMLYSNAYPAGGMLQAVPATNAPTVGK